MLLSWSQFPELVGLIVSALTGITQEALSCSISTTAQGISPIRLLTQRQLTRSPQSTRGFLSQDPQLPACLSVCLWDWDNSPLRKSNLNFRPTLRLSVVTEPQRHTGTLRERWWQWQETTSQFVCLCSVVNVNNERSDQRERTRPR